jgi:hypothetical protein
MDDEGPEVELCSIDFETDEDDNASSCGVSGNIGCSADSIAQGVVGSVQFRVVLDQTEVCVGTMQFDKNNLVQNLVIQGMIDVLNGTHTVKLLGKARNCNGLVRAATQPASERAELLLSVTSSDK